MVSIDTGLRVISSPSTFEAVLFFFLTSETIEWPKIHNDIQKFSLSDTKLISYAVRPGSWLKHGFIYSREIGNIHQRWLTFPSYLGTQ